MKYNKRTQIVKAEKALEEQNNALLDIESATTLLRRLAYICSPCIKI